MYSLDKVDGNAFSIMAYVSSAMRYEGYTQEDISKYQEDAMRGDYRHLLSVSYNMIDKINQVKYN